MLLYRFLAGLAGAGYSPNIQIFVGEISMNEHRGILLGLTMPVMGVGVLLVYALGAMLPWDKVSAVCVSAPLLLAISSWWISNSRKL